MERRTAVAPGLTRTTLARPSGRVVSWGFLPSAPRMYLSLTFHLILFPSPAEGQPSLIPASKRVEGGERGWGAGFPGAP